MTFSVSSDGLLHASRKSATASKAQARAYSLNFMVPPGEQSIFFLYLLNEYINFRHRRSGLSRPRQPGRNDRGDSIGRLLRCKMAQSAQYFVINRCGKVPGVMQQHRVIVQVSMFGTE